jgi:hypothetical protein
MSLTADWNLPPDSTPLADPLAADAQLHSATVAVPVTNQPVASMKSGSLKGGFSMPRLPWRYFRFWLQ